MPPGRFPGGGAVRLSGLQNRPGDKFTTAIGPVAWTGAPRAASGMQRAVQLQRHRKGNLRA